MVNSASRRLDCGLDAEYLRARAVRAERYSCRGDPHDQSAGVAHDGDRLRPDARSTTWPERARAASDLSVPCPYSNWLRCSSHGFCHLERSLPHAYARHRPALVCIRTLIADEEPRFLTAWVPHEADVGFQRLFLPHTCCAIPAIASFEHDLVKALPRLFQFAVEETPTGMSPTDAQQIVPPTSGAELAGIGMPANPRSAIKVQDVSGRWTRT